MYEYAVKVVSVHDGDTVHAEVDLGFDLRIRATLRLKGIDAPELNTAEGKRARDYLREEGPKVVKMKTYKDRKEKYGRYLATLYDAEGEDLNQRMIDTGHAVAYDGGKRG